MKTDELKEFCDLWLESWTGNQPERLIEFYANDAYYADPARPVGLKGLEQLLEYFRKLLQKNPDWVWTAKEIIPTQKGFTLKWEAKIPTSSKLVVVEGLDIVELSGNKISRNEVFFDRSMLR